MLSIAYVSGASAPMDEEQILAMLTRARSNNQRDGVTGALLYHRQRFIQLLEGPEPMVRARFAVIAVDPRHQNVQVLRERQIDARQFADWTMSFRFLPDDARAELAGFDNFFTRRGRARLEHAENEAQQFLEWAAEYWLPPA